MFDIVRFSLNLRNYPLGWGKNVNLIDVTKSEILVNIDCSLYEECSSLKLIQKWGWNEDENLKIYFFTILGSGMLKSSTYFLKLFCKTTHWSGVPRNLFNSTWFFYDIDLFCVPNHIYSIFGIRLGITVSTRLEPIQICHLSLYLLHS